jgi:hypothetical protein
MPIRGRVGKHANTGAQCQNWSDDQKIIIDLLNSISVVNGGTEAKLNVRTVSGIASDALCQAILVFQKKHFPAQQSGFVEPIGPMLQKIEALAATVPTPEATGPWDVFKSGSVQRALREALIDENLLSQSKVVEILRATLANGIVSASELDDLKMVATKSNTIMDRSKKMILYLDSQVGGRFGGPPIKFDSKNQLFAANMVCDFLKMRNHTRWTNVDRDEVGVGILLRRAKPGILHQRNASLCGPSSLLFTLLLDQPIEYARYAIDMYEKGYAHIGRIFIKPSPRIFLAKLDTIDPVDWITMASLRDSENWILDYQTASREFAGMTLPGELADWFRRAGYSDVRQDANVLRRQRGTETMDEASRLFISGYRVCLFIAGNMIEAENQTTSATLPDHWVPLVSPIERSGDQVKLTVHSWGNGATSIPQRAPLSLTNFLENFYGYVAAHPL